MSFFKHVGTANGTKKVIIVQRQLPGEEHMAAVIYSDIIPSRFHDDIMKELESPAGQSVNEFKELLERRMFSNGENMLRSLQTEGYIKKVASNNVVVRPNSKSSIRLDELNRILGDIRTGRVATEELSKLDKGVSESPGETATVEDLAPVSADDRVAKLEAMIMGLTQTVQTLVNSQPVKKSRTKA
jgi:hypothetical protein